MAWLADFLVNRRLAHHVLPVHAAPLPILVPFIYVQLKLRRRAYNAAAAHLRAIQAFYSYAKSRDLDFAGLFCALTAEYSGLCAQHLADLTPQARSVDDMSAIYFDYLDAMHEVASEKLLFRLADRILYRLDIERDNKIRQKKSPVK